MSFGLWLVHINRTHMHYSRRHSDTRVWWQNTCVTAGLSCQSVVSGVLVQRSSSFFFSKPDLVSSLFRFSRSSFHSFILSASWNGWFSASLRDVCQPAGEFPQDGHWKFKTLNQSVTIVCVWMSEFIITDCEYVLQAYYKMHPSLFSYFAPSYLRKKQPLP